MNGGQSFAAVAAVPCRVTEFSPVCERLFNIRLKDALEKQAGIRCVFCLPRLVRMWEKTSQGRVMVHDSWRAESGRWQCEVDKEVMSLWHQRVQQHKGYDRVSKKRPHQLRRWHTHDSTCRFYSFAPVVPHQKLAFILEKILVA